MMKRLLIAGVVLALIGAACGDDTADTGSDQTATTVVATTDGSVPPPDTTPPETAATTTMPTGPFVVAGELSARVAALQFFLSCDGYGPVTIDGSFGDETGVAVSLAQSDLGYAETGEPDKALFAELARGCDQGRDVFFPPGSDSTQTAGWVEDGVVDEVGLTGTADRMLTIDPSPGDPVGLSLLAEDGSTVVEETVGQLQVTLPDTGRYTVRVTSALGPAAYVLVVTLSGNDDGQAVDASSIVLDENDIGDLGLVELGQSADDVVQIMSAKLGAPANDTGDETDTGCPGTHRQVTWSIPAPAGGVASTLTLHFHDDDGRWADMELTDWAYWPSYGEGDTPGMPGLLVTQRGIGLGSTTAEAIAAYPELEFGMNALSGDVMGWVGDFEMIVYADFGPGPFDMGTDFGALDGYVTGIRLPLNNCPDELSY